MGIDLLIGRGLAFCVHPRAAWRVLSTPGRAFVVAAYAGAGYVAVLGGLIALLRHRPVVLTGYFSELRSSPSLRDSRLSLG